MGRRVKSPSTLIPPTMRIYLASRYSSNILLQPFFPLSRREAAADAFFFNTLQILPKLLEYILREGYHRLTSKKTVGVTCTPITRFIWTTVSNVLS